MIGKLIKIVAIGTIGLATGLVGLGLLAALDDADYPLEWILHSFIYLGRVERIHRKWNIWLS